MQPLRRTHTRASTASVTARRLSLQTVTRVSCAVPSAYAQVAKAGVPTEHIYFVREGELVEILDVGGTDGPAEVGFVKVCVCAFVRACVRMRVRARACVFG